MHRGDRQRDVHRQRLPHVSATASRRRRASSTCTPLTPRASASSRIRSARGSTGRWTGCPNPGPSRPPHAIARATSRTTAAGCLALLDTRCSLREQPRALVRGAEDDRIRLRGSPRRRHPGARPGSAASVIRAATFVGIIPCSAIETSSEVEEEPLLLRRLASGQQQVEVLRERQSTHEVAGQVAPADLHPIRVGLRDVADRALGLLADRHRTDDIGVRLGSCHARGSPRPETCRGVRPCETASPGNVPGTR